MRKVLMFLIFNIIFYITVIAGGPKTPEEFGAHTPHLTNDDRHALQMDALSEVLPERIAPGQILLSKMPESLSNMTLLPGQQEIDQLYPVQLSEKISRGSTFSSLPFSSEHNIRKLTSAVTELELDRKLFGAVHQTASYFHIRYLKTAPFVSSTYVQFVTDPLWNRLLYGNMNHWIKSYDNLQQPTAIEVDASGRIFIIEKGKSQITVLQIMGQDNDIDLQFLYSINDIGEPADIALSDNSTPLDVSDDFLYVVDGKEDKIHKIKIGADHAEIIRHFNGFDTPSGITVGKWDGANNNLVYVVDQIARRIRIYSDSGDQLNIIKTYEGSYQQYFTDIETDHFGNIYLVDYTNSQILKYNANLDFLDLYGDNNYFAGLRAVEIPFGKIEIEGEGSYWAGYDQIFAMEKWSEHSGAERNSLGIKIRDFELRSDNDISKIEALFTLTDFCKYSFEVFNQDDKIAYNSSGNWSTSGSKQLSWDRKDKSESYVLPGNYRFDLIAESPYSGETVEISTEIYLPLYYRGDFRETENRNDPFLVQGKPVSWSTDGSKSALEHPDAVKFEFNYLDPEKSYEIAIEYLAGDGIQRMQDVTASGLEIITPFEVNSQFYKTDFVQVPQESYPDGQLSISINSLSDGSAVVSQIWLKETVESYIPQEELKLIPQEYFLSQNYPNPFNPETTINFELPERTNVNLSVYDILGRKVHTIIDDVRSAGRYSISYSADNLATGIYVYQLRAGEFIQTKKMLVIK